MPNDNLLQLLNLPTQNANTEMDNQNDNTNVNWQSDLLGWVYSNTLERDLLTSLTNNQMTKQDLARVLVSVLANKPTNQQTDVSSRVIEKLNSEVIRKQIRDRSQHKREARLLKFCKLCKRVYQKDFTSPKDVYYDSLCSYKLPRENCKQCRSIK